MARSRSSSTSVWRYVNPAYYLKRPKRLALLFIAFVCVTLIMWDRQTLVKEHEEEIAKLNGEVLKLQNMMDDLNNRRNSGAKVEVIGEHRYPKIKEVAADGISIERREKVKDAMRHAWSSYEQYAWPQDELQPQTKNGVDSFGGLGATLIDSLDTLYIMGLDEEFQRAREQDEASVYDEWNCRFVSSSSVFCQLLLAF